MPVPELYLPDAHELQVFSFQPVVVWYFPVPHSAQAPPLLYAPALQLYGQSVVPLPGPV